MPSSLEKHASRTAAGWAYLETKEEASTWISTIPASDLSPSFLLKRGGQAAFASSADAKAVARTSLRSSALPSDRSGRRARPTSSVPMKDRRGCKDRDSRYEGGLLSVAGQLRSIVVTNACVDVEEAAAERRPRTESQEAARRFLDDGEKTTAEMVSAGGVRVTSREDIARAVRG